MTEQDTSLEEELFDMAATRPNLTLGLPHTLSVSLLMGCVLFVMFYSTGNIVNDLIGDAVGIGAIGMLWSFVRVLLRNDYHGWGNFCAYMALDGRFLDTTAWGGAHISSFPLNSIYNAEAHDAE